MNWSEMNGPLKSERAGGAVVANWLWYCISIWKINDDDDKGKSDHYRIDYGRVFICFESVGNDLLSAQM